MSLWRVYREVVPAGITAEDLGRPTMPKHCWVYGRAESRIAFARKLIAAELDTRSPNAVSSWVRHQGGICGSEDSDMVPPGDSGIYVRAPDARPGPGDEWAVLPPA